MAGQVTPTKTPAIANAPVLGLAEGSSTFSNYHLAAVVLGVPWLVKRILPFVSRGGFYTYWTLVAVMGVPLAIAYWYIMSRIGSRVNERVPLPGKDIEEYIDIKDVELKREYSGKNKIPMQIFHDAYFDGKIDFKGDVLEIMERRHDWAAFHMTPELFKYVLFNLIPEVIVHSQNQDEEQVRDHYDRGDDFYGWFLGPRMIYTSGIVLDLGKEETLEQLQDNKLTVVCEKLGLQPGDRLLDIGCGWGTLVAFAAKNYGVDATGVTLARKQTAFGNARIKSNGIDPSQARILCKDFRDVKDGPGAFNKIVSLEMAEHVGIRRYGQFLRQIYGLLDDDGVFLLQVAGIRSVWQYEDLIWGLFMNKYVFPGADASCSLNWVINQVRLIIRFPFYLISNPFTPSLRPMDLRSRISTFLVFIIAQRSGAGIRTGSQTKTRWLPPTENAGTAFGCSSSPGRPSSLVKEAHHCSRSRFTKT
ncbi:hypothetical protein FRC18_010316 [Serendipita sp. 400]|nr:hypothetical protein FRC18_010316 [Serendipita sp. 400]